MDLWIPERVTSVRMGFISGCYGNAEWRRSQLRGNFWKDDNESDRTLACEVQLAKKARRPVMAGRTWYLRRERETLVSGEGCLGYWLRLRFRGRGDDGGGGGGGGAHSYMGRLATAARAQHVLISHYFFSFAIMFTGVRLVIEDSGFYWYTEDGYQCRILNFHNAFLIILIYHRDTWYME